MHGISEPVVLYERISLRRPGYSAALVTLNRPDKYNCFNTEMVSRLSQIFADIADEADTTLIAVIFTGKGTSFCAGADLKDPPDPIKQSSDLPCCLNDNPVYQMGRVAIPIIGAVQGYVGFLMYIVETTCILTIFIIF